MNRLQTYYQLTKPGIIYGNAITAAAGFLFASQWDIEAGLFLATLAGTSLVIAAACVYNNYIDRGIDQKMARTKKRALVKGTITGPTALAYATMLGIAGFLVLSFFTNWWVVGLGIIAFVNYVVFYGLAKRHSEHGTLVGTISGAASLTAGYVAVTNQLDTAAVLLFIIMVCWQMPHFYAIALYRLKDYTAAHIPVLPARRGVLTTKLQIIAYTVAFVVSVCMVSFLGYTGYTFLVIMETIGLLWLVVAVKGLTRKDTTQWARQMFLLSLGVLLSFSVMLSVGAILP